MYKIKVIVYHKELKKHRIYKFETDDEDNDIFWFLRELGNGTYIKRELDDEVISIQCELKQ